MSIFEISTYAPFFVLRAWNKSLLLQIALDAFIPASTPMVVFRCVLWWSPY